MNGNKLIFCDFNKDGLEREYCEVNNLENFQNKLYEF